MPDEYAKCSVFCFPTAYAEGVPRVLIEAAASSRPIVTTDTPGCREIVRHGENGMLVPVRSPEAVAAAIEALLRDPARRQAMGRRGRELVRDRFSEETVIGATLALYGAVSGSAGPDGRARRAGG
jgi:glycosyltransferase involved in cell wall biosynthesis